MSIYRKAELGIFLVFFSSLMLQIRGINTSFITVISLLALGIWWIYCLVRSKKINEDGFRTPHLAEKLLYAPLLWGMTGVISDVPHVTFIIKFGVLVLSCFYFFNGIVKWARNKKEWMNGAERIVLSFLLLGILFRLFDWPFNVIPRLLCMLLLMVLMIVFGSGIFSKLNRSEYKSIALQTLFVYLVLAFGTIALTFRIMFWPGGIILISFFLLLLLGISISFLIKSYGLQQRGRETSDAGFYMYHTRRRIFVFAAAGVLSYFVYSKVFMKFQYGNYPEMIEAIYNMKNHDLSEKERAIWTQKADSLYEKFQSGEYRERPGQNNY